MHSTYVGIVAVNLFHDRLSVVQKKIHGLSPRAKYTDRSTAFQWYSDCQFANSFLFIICRIRTKRVLMMAYNNTTITAFRNFVRLP
jgi:hypothetical protein